MRLAILWTGVTEPMAACWRELAARPDVSLTVFTELPPAPDTAYRHEVVLAGLDAHVHRADRPLDRTALERQLVEAAPDAMVILGWRSPMCRFAAEHPALAGVPTWIAFDMTWAPTTRKVLAPLVLGRYLRRFTGAIVPGERSAAYAAWLGFAESRIERGSMYGVDTAARAEEFVTRSSLAAWPRRFLYAGRYAREKRIDVLVAAYRRYRSLVRDPWELTCCGMGPDARLLAGVEGIRDLGFVQPAEMPRLRAEHGAFVLASDYDPWPFVITEAVASGLPIACTSACGNTVELVRSWFNGRIVAPGDVAGLTQALAWLHGRGADLKWIGERGMPLVAPYAKEAWADRILAICQRA
ncbi:MAG: glycosyltransferase family 4 protein [Planctomycetaceae bacterium]